MSIAEKKIMNLLKNSGVEFKLFEHKPVYTCKQAAEERGVSLKRGIKCLLLKSGSGFVLALTRGNKRIDLKKIAALEGVKRVKLASEKAIKKTAECPKGCVHPFCGVKTYVDRDFLKEKKIEFNPGCHDKTIKMNSSDLIKLIENPVIERIGIESK